MELENIIFIRHAHAGKRERWFGDDSLRPLSAKGNLQANKIGKKFKDVAPLLIFSSPKTRCTETVGVLSQNSSQPINILDSLNENGSFESSLKFALEQKIKTVILSTHGDTMYDLSKYLNKNKLSKKEVKNFEVPKAGYWWIKIKKGKLTSAKLFKI